MKVKISKYMSYINLFVGSLLVVFYFINELRKKISDKFTDEKFILNNKDGYYLWKKEIKLQKIFSLPSIGKEL